MPTEHKISTLKINKLTDAQYNSITKSASELYLTPDDGDGLPDQTGNNGKFLTTNGTTASWATVTAGGGSVTSVQVQATSPIVSSVNTAQTTSLNTTISLADGYGDTKNPYASKTANTVLAAPNGSNGSPSFRALVKADIPLASETAASGGTTTSLVTTGEKYTWNSKQDALPSQSGNSGKFLTTNGSTMSWGSISANNVTTALGYTPYNSTNPNGYTTNTGTVTSVQVQAGTGLTSSTSTAQNTTLSTTIGVDSNYKLPTTTEWNGKQDTIADLGYIRNKAALVDDKISGVDITNSGSSLPATTSYSVGNTFLNTSNNKLYTTLAPAWKLNTGTSYDSAISVNLTTGLATGFGTGSYSSYSMYTPMSNFNWTGSNRQHIYFHFSMSSNTNNGYMWGVYNSSNYRLHIRYNGTYFYFNYFRYYSGTWYGYFDTQLFSTTPQINTEYYIHLYKNGDECVGTLALDDYDTNIVETSTIPTTDVSITSGNYCIGGNQIRYATLSGLSVYLADTTGEFIIPDGALTWDSGVTLEDNTQYNDTTNVKTYYYNNNILYLPSPKFSSFTNISATNWVADNTYQDYGYKCDITCSGVTANDYAQVNFGVTEADSGDYATVCATSANTVTIYSKVDDSITIPSIIIMGA